jgi:hypothetical protein
MGGLFLGARGWCCSRVESAGRPPPRPWPGVPGEGVEGYRGREWRGTGGGKWEASSSEQGDGAVRGWRAPVGPHPGPGPVYRGREWRRTGGGKWEACSSGQGAGAVRGWRARVGPHPSPPPAYRGREWGRTGGGNQNGTSSHSNALGPMKRFWLHRPAARRRKLVTPSRASVLHPLLSDVTAQSDLIERATSTKDISFRARFIPDLADMTR